MVRARIGRRKGGDCGGFKDGGPEFPGAIEKYLIEEASLYRDLSIVARGKLDARASSSDSDELDTIQFSVWRTSNPLGHFQPSQDRPAGRVQAIAANFLAREFFAFDDYRSKTGSRARSRAT